jgi:hypothetical protein
MKKAPLLTLSLLLALPLNAHAETAAPTMRHMVISPKAEKAEAAPAGKPAAAPVAAVPKPAVAAAPKVAEEPVAQTPAARKPLTPAEALRKPEDLKVWSGLADTVVLQSDAAIDKMIRIVEADPGAVPPQGLLFLARALVSKNRIEEAALYFYVSQVRLAFDSARWPPRLDPEQLKALLAEKKKSPDQQLDLPTPELENPHQQLVDLSSQIGQPITRWMILDPKHAEETMAKVKAWDESAPYAYQPGYALPQPVAFKDWENLLVRARTNFYSQITQVIELMKSAK